MKMTIFLSVTCLSVLYSTSATAQFEKAPWREKVRVIQTRRNDVEKAFGKPASGHDYLVTYNLNDGVLDLEYYPFDHCKPSGKTQADLNVSEWTVTDIVFRPNRQLSVEALNLDLRLFRKSHMNPDLPDLVSYFDDKHGVEYTVDESNGTLNNVRYFPGSRYDSLRCSKK